MEGNRRIFCDLRHESQQGRKEWDLRRYSKVRTAEGLRQDGIAFCSVTFFCFTQTAFSLLLLFKSFSLYIKENPSKMVEGEI